VIKLLLAEDVVDPNFKDKDGRTPLSWAAQKLSWAVQKRDEAVVKLFLAKGSVDPDSMNTNGRTALSLATENGPEAVVKSILRMKRRLCRSWRVCFPAVSMKIERSVKLSFRTLEQYCGSTWNQKLARYDGQIFCTISAGLIGDKDDTTKLTRVD
jgi:hypothetical protein